MKRVTPVAIHRSALAAILAATACGNDPTGPITPGEGVRLQTVASGLDFPVLVTAPLSDQTRLFVVEKGGTIRIIKNGQLLATPFLDIRAKVSHGNEQGLLGLAFNPGYDTNGLFVIDYTDTNGDTRVSVLHVSSNPDVADPSTEEVFLFVEQPFDNHNGGHVTFGPFGYLFIGLGDGGSGGDPDNHAQDLTSPLGKIHRYQMDESGHVTIPTGNPFVGNPGILWGTWSWGLRNPWRFSFDRETGSLYIGDVGQDRREEINIAPGPQGSGRSLNFGWRTMEGTLCYNPLSGCDKRDLTEPAIEYGHDEGCSVTGGHVYRGQALPDLRGAYFYADYCAGWVRSFRFTSGPVQDQREWSALSTGEHITSFGEDAVGELYIVTQEGRIYRLAPG